MPVDFINAKFKDNDAVGHVSGIPIRNIWLLMLYASPLYKEAGHGKVSAEGSPEQIPDLVAEILCRSTEKRLKQHLSRGYERVSAVLGRVRGRIELLRTERDQLLRRGQVACQFDALTINTPPNRYVRAALLRLSRIVHSPQIRHRCVKLSSSLQALGIAGDIPPWPVVCATQSNRVDSEERVSVQAARLAFQFLLPTESAGSRLLAAPGRDPVWLRSLYEKAVHGFYAVRLNTDDWTVKANQPISWDVTHSTSRIPDLLPSMRMDVVLLRHKPPAKIVIDTKFTSILTAGRFGGLTFSSAYLYQIYAYLRSQERASDSLAHSATGILLHPAVGEHIDETAVIQGHAITFATVDLAADAASIAARLLDVIVPRHS